LGDTSVLALLGPKDPAFLRFNQKSTYADDIF